jgi:serine/threonine protein kinase
VAVKRLLPNFGGNERFQAMFLEEARVVADLQHPNIASFYELCHDDGGMLCIVMEWVDGVDLSRMLLAARDVARPVAVPDAAFIATSVLKALSAAHRRASGPVFHRDVTPANILVSRTGEVKLTDFGLARAMDRMTVTLPGVVVGKLAYVAPELIAAERSTAASDIYSLGVVLWEMLAGRRLFHAQNELELFMLAGRAVIPSLDELRDDVPARAGRGGAPDDATSSLAQRLACAQAAGRVAERLRHQCSVARRWAAGPRRSAHGHSTQAVAATPGPTAGRGASRPGRPWWAAPPPR